MLDSEASFQFPGIQAAQYEKLIKSLSNVTQQLFGARRSIQSLIC